MTDELEGLEECCRLKETLLDSIVEGQRKLDAMAQNEEEVMLCAFSARRFMRVCVYIYIYIYIYIIWQDKEQGEVQLFHLLYKYIRVYI